jgi:hypothetical protein
MQILFGIFIYIKMKKSSLEPYAFTQFYGTYLAALGDVDVYETLEDGLHEFVKFVNAIPDDALLFAYSQHKWTVAQVLGHIIDTERVFQYRALRFSRNDQTPLPGFEQDDYVATANSNARSKESLVEEFVAVRKSTITLFHSFTKEQLNFKGTASHIPWSVSGLGFVISGHVHHHLNILRERYLIA